MKSTLKTYEASLLKLKGYLKATEIKLIWKSTSSDGIWHPSKRMIQIDPDLSEKDTLATLLHEIGHCIDDNSIPDKTLNKLADAYIRVYTDTFSQDNVDIVVRTEIRAWSYARAIAKILRIRLGKWFTMIEAKAIKDYKNLGKQACT